MNLNDQEMKQLLDSVDISGLDVPRKSVKYPRTEELLEYSANQIKKITGQDFKIMRDFANFFFYVSPLIKNFELASLALIDQVFTFLMYDYLEYNPKECGKWETILYEKSCSGSGKLELLFNSFVKIGMKVIKEKALDHLLKLTYDCVLLIPMHDKLYHGNQSMTEKEFINFRLKQLGVEVMFYISQLDSGLEELPQGLCDDITWISFNREVGKQICFVNELFSLKKEVKDGKMKGNYVDIKMRNREITAQKALDDIISEIKECEEKAIHLGKSLKLSGNECIDRYVDHLIAAINGHIYWSSISKRYDKI